MSHQHVSVIRPIPEHRDALIAVQGISKNMLRRIACRIMMVGSVGPAVCNWQDGLEIERGRIRAENIFKRVGERWLRGDVRENVNEWSRAAKQDRIDKEIARALTRSRIWPTVRAASWLPCAIMSRLLNIQHRTTECLLVWHRNFQQHTMKSLHSSIKQLTTAKETTSRQMVSLKQQHKRAEQALKNLQEEQKKLQEEHEKFKSDPKIVQLEKKRTAALRKMVDHICDLKVGSSVAKWYTHYAESIMAGSTLIEVEGVLNSMEQEPEETYEEISEYEGNVENEASEEEFMDDEW